MIPVKNSATPGSERKRLGAFYTPENLSRVLTDWAIRTPTDNVLEPSFGGCGFLAAARRRLEYLGCKNAKGQIFGCDVDKEAFVFLAEVLGVPIDTEKFRQEDFLDLRAEVQWPILFNAAVGNPPYIPFQAIPENRRRELTKRSAAKGIKVGGRASLWAHFLIHAVSFVAPKGRMAWVLPGSFLQADYSVAVRDFLSRSFSDVLCVLMHQRFFKQEGTEEETVILLARDRRDDSSKNSISFVDAASIQDLDALIERWEQGERVGRPLDARPSFFSIRDSVAADFGTLRKRADCFCLADFLTTHIGLVTGANAFFVISEKERARNSLDQGDTLPILGKFKAVQGLAFTREDHDAYLQQGGRGHLVYAKAPPPEGTPLQKYLESFPAEQRESIGTFKKRTLWCNPVDGKIPDAFISVMNHDGPRVVLNNADIYCTNTIHRAFFKKDIQNKIKKLIAISLMTSFSQLSAEFEGRRYGSGVLKHELAEVGRLAVLIPQQIADADIEEAFKKIDGLLRLAKMNEAREAADLAILHRLEGGKAKASAFRLSLAEVRDQRRITRYALGV